MESLFFVALACGGFCLAVSVLYPVFTFIDWLLHWRGVKSYIELLKEEW